MFYWWWYDQVEQGVDWHNRYQQRKKFIAVQQSHFAEGLNDPIIIKDAKSSYRRKSYERLKWKRYEPISPAIKFTPGGYKSCKKTDSLEQTSKSEWSIPYSEIERKEDDCVTNIKYIEIFWIRITQERQWIQSYLQVPKQSKPWFKILSGFVG